jgi:hypothetical protein
MKAKSFPIVLGKTMGKLSKGFGQSKSCVEVDYGPPFKVIWCKNEIKKKGQSNAFLQAIYERASNIQTDQTFASVSLTLRLAQIQKRERDNKTIRFIVSFICSGAGNRTRVSTVRGSRARPLHYIAIIFTVQK